MRMRFLPFLGLGGLLAAVAAPAAVTVAAGEVKAPAAPAPIAFTYTMPYEGFLALQIVDKATGTLVRRLVAEVPRPQGPVTETWDGKDDAGQYVKPGDYAWSAIARPPLKLTYEYTVNNAGQPAWWAPKPGKGGGGWLSDHSLAHEVCAVGDVVFIGAGGGENAHALIAVDRAGNKLWGIGSPFGAFSGVTRMASDGAYAYVQNGTEIVRVDPQHDFARVKLNIDYQFSRAYPAPAGGGGAFYDGGLAARQGKLYLTVRSKGAPWVRSSFTPEQVAGAQCLPAVINRKRPEEYGEDWTETERFHAAFADGGAANSANGNGYGEAPKNGPLKDMLTVVYTRPVALGSVLVPDGRIKVYALKDGAKLPTVSDEPEEDAAETEVVDPALWTPLTVSGKPGAPALALPAQGMRTQALRFTATRLPYALVTERRMADVAPAAERVFAAGGAVGNGWAVQRNSADRPISKEDPACMALVWQTPVAVRGLSLVQPDSAFFAVDVWTGAGDPKAAVEAGDGWQQVGYVEAGTRGPRATTPLAHHIDFGEVYTTRAVRVRAVLPANTRGYMGNINPVSGPHTAAVSHFIAYSPAGNDLPFPAELTRRVVEISLPADPTKEKGTVTKNLPLPEPGYLAFSPDGTLYAVSAGRIVTVPLDGGAIKEVLSKEAAGNPCGLAFDADGLLYVASRATSRIHVFDVRTGQRMRTIGQGPIRVGPWDPAAMTWPYGLTVDRAGKLWVADCTVQPKRVLRFTREGKVEAEYLGSAFYGGGGNIDAGDPAVLYYMGMKFVADRAKQTWALESIVHTPEAPECVMGRWPDRAVTYQGRRYLLGDPGGIGFWAYGALICTERDGKAQALVAAGNLGQWSGEIKKRPDLNAKFGKLNQADYGFLWIDQNGDHLPQAEEVQTTKASKLTVGMWGTPIGEDLSLNFTGARLPLAGLRADGTPLYDLAKLVVNPALGDRRWTAADGAAFVVGEGDVSLLAPDGRTRRWSYPDRYAGVHGSHRIGYDRPPGTLVGTLKPVGHFALAGEELFVANGNHGDWFAFTRDGLLAAAIFGGPVGYGKRTWTMPEWSWGKTDLSDLTLGEEHFGGSITKAADGRVYAVAGHNHNSVVRVDGLEAMKRLTGSVTVTKEALTTLILSELTTARPSPDGPQRMTMPWLNEVPLIDGQLEEWYAIPFVPIRTHVSMEKKTVVDIAAALAYDEEHLYVAARVTDDSPALNTADDPELFFKGGDALDIGLGIDPHANPKRIVPAVGDLRVLLGRWKGKPLAVIYRYVVPGTPEKARRLFPSPITTTAIDMVAVLKDADVAVVAKGQEWVVEAALPWQQLGVAAPAVNSRIRGDVGVLLGDNNGLRTTQRFYWAGKSQTIVSDTAFEARIAPALWGELVCIETKAALEP
jgi:hypothetical protein